MDLSSKLQDIMPDGYEPIAATIETDIRGYTRVGWLLVFIGLLGFLMWASFAPLDRGVSASGTVIKESNRKTIQHQTGGAIEEILVKEGETVYAGQVLVKMNRIFAQASYDIANSQYLNALATEARLNAEVDGARFINFPEVFKKLHQDPSIAELMALQRRLLAARQGALSNELSSINENIAGLTNLVRGLKDSRDRKIEQVAILKEQLASMQELARSGYVTRVRLLDMERSVSETNGALSADIGNLGQASSQIAELSLRKMLRIQEYQKEVSNMLADARREVETQKARMQAQSYELSSVEVRSPVDGIVQDIAVFTKGGVVPPGFRMMDIVPTADLLVVEGKLQVNVIDKVWPGLPVELILSAFNANETPHISSEITQVSIDTSFDERSGAAYYKFRVKVTPDGAQTISSNKITLVAGMPVELFVKTGERTMMSYLFKPVIDRVRTAFSED